MSDGAVSVVNWMKGDIITGFSVCVAEWPQLILAIITTLDPRETHRVSRGTPNAAVYIDSELIGNARSESDASLLHRECEHVPSTVGYHAVSGSRSDPSPKTKTERHTLFVNGLREEI